MASQSMEVVAKALEQQVLQSARVVEEQLDAELQQLQTMDEDDLDRLKERRLEALKKAQKQKQVGALNIFKELNSKFGVKFIKMLIQNKLSTRGVY